MLLIRWRARQSCPHRVTGAQDGEPSGSAGAEPRAWVTHFMLKERPMLTTIQIAGLQTYAPAAWHSCSGSRVRRRWPAPRAAGRWRCLPQRGPHQGCAPLRSRAGRAVRSGGHPPERACSAPARREPAPARRHWRGHSPPGRAARAAGRAVRLTRPRQTGRSLPGIRKPTSHSIRA